MLWRLFVLDLMDRRWHASVQRGHASVYGSGRVTALARASVHDRVKLKGRIRPCHSSQWPHRVVDVHPLMCSCFV
jgi:hypothetical protein